MQSSATERDWKSNAETGERKRESGIHKTIIDKHDRLIASAVLVEGVSEGVHSADDYFIYRWKRIQNWAINAQMRPASEWLQPGHLSAQQNRQVQSYFNVSLPPSTLEQPTIKQPPIRLRLWEKKNAVLSSYGGTVNEPAWPMRNYSQLGRSIRAVCGHVSTHSCTQAPSQIFCYHGSACCETTTPCIWYGPLMLSREGRGDRK